MRTARLPTAPAFAGLTTTATLDPCIRQTNPGSLEIPGSVQVTQ